MFERIFVPLDGSEHAERALPIATRIARATDGTLIFVSVVFPLTEYGTYTVSQMVNPYPTAHETQLKRASAYLDEILLRYEVDMAGIKTEKIVTSGTASPTIFEEANLQHADLIVLCSRGETGLKRWVFRSVAQQAVRYSPVPILVLNEHGDFPPFTHQKHLLRILVPLDGSLLAETALEPTIRLMALLAGSTQTALHLLEVIDIPFPYGKLRVHSEADQMMQKEELQKARQYLHDVTTRLLAHLPVEFNLTITSAVMVHKDIAKTILAEAEPAEEELRREPYDLIAIATHGRGRLQRLLMGSVTEQLLGATKLPLLIVRPHEKAIQQKQANEVEVLPHLSE